MRALILSCNTGEGHNSCGRAIQDRFRASGVPCDMEDALRFISPVLARIVSAGHAWIYRHAPGLFSWGYRYTESRPGVFGDGSAIRRLLALGAGRLERFIREGGYDTVICPHVFASLLMAEVRRRYAGAIRLYAVETDYTCSPGWEMSRPDGCFIPARDLAEEFLRRGIGADRLFVSGIPLRRTFCRRGDKLAAKAALGLPEDCRHLLVMCGSMGCGPIRRVVHLIAAALPEKAKVSVICGTNRRLYRAMSREYRNNRRVGVFPYVPDVSAMMDSADLFLTKPGGISTSEAARKGLPMLFVSAVEGCESHNRDYFLRLGVAAAAEGVHALADTAVSLLSSGEALAQMAARFPPEPKMEAAEIIVRQILSQHSLSEGEHLCPASRSL